MASVLLMCVFSLHVHNSYMYDFPLEDMNSLKLTLLLIFVYKLH